LKKAFLGDAADERPAAVSLTERLSSAAERLVPPTVELRVEIDRAAEKITAAPEAFDRILAVLLENAVQAMDSRGALVIRASRPAGSSRVRIDVADSGPGVPQDVRRRIFNPFFSTKRRTGGTGMGLWFAYRSAARMGGELTLVDAGGAASRGAASPGGAVFRLELPAAD